MLEIKKEEWGFLITQKENTWQSAFLTSKYGEKKVVCSEKEIKVNFSDLVEVTKEKTAVCHVLVSRSQPQNETRIPLIANRKETLLIGNLEHLEGETRYSCYISQDDKIRFYNEGGISSKSYFIKGEVENLTWTSSNLIFDFCLQTKYTSAKKIVFYLRDRRTKREHRLIGFQKIINQENKLGKIWTTFKVIIPTNDLNELVRISYEAYQTYFEWLDLFFHFEIEANTLNLYKRRVAYTDLQEKKISNEASFDEDYTILYDLQTTIYDNLSINYKVYEKKLLKQINEISSVSHPLKSKKIILIGEYPTRAEDTGLALFRELLLNYSRKYDVYYVLSKESKDVEKFSNCKKHLIYHGSLEHVSLYFQADILCHSHSLTYLMPAVIPETIRKSRETIRIFIQHGVLGKRDMLNLYGYQKGNFTDYIVSSSLREKKLIHEELDYPNERIILSGLSRFDSLLKKEKNPFKYFLEKKKRKHQIFMFFTWRPNLLHLSVEEFQKSNYFQVLQSLLTNEKLEIICRNFDLEVTFKLHHNLSQYTTLFSSSFIKISTVEDSQTIQEYLKSSGLMITDFSSAALDFSLLERPVIYYNFEEKEKLRTGSNALLPGFIYFKEEDLLKGIEEYLPDMRMKSEHIDKLNDIYQFRDTNAVSRLMRFIDKETKTN